MASTARGPQACSTTSPYPTRVSDFPPFAPMTGARADHDSSGGLILWSKSFTPAFSALTVTPASPINALVKEAFIEGKARNEEEGFERDGYSVRWTMENGLGLVFVVRPHSEYSTTNAAG